MEIDSARIGAWVGQFVWPFLRLSAFLLAAPLFGARSVPVRVRITIAVALAALLVPTLPPMPAVDFLSPLGLLTALQQVGIGTDQLLRILRVAPEVWRVLRITGRHQALAFACGNGKCRHQQQSEQQKRRPIKTTLKHWRLLDLTLDGRLRPHIGRLLDHASLIRIHTNSR